eukprot:31198-Pelagococcus_subviridis.AAC.59
MVVVERVVEPSLDRRRGEAGASRDVPDFGIVRRVGFELRKAKPPDALADEQRPSGETELDEIVLPGIRRDDAGVGAGVPRATLGLRRGCEPVDVTEAHFLVVVRVVDVVVVDSILAERARDVAIARPMPVRCVTRRGRVRRSRARRPSRDALERSAACIPRIRHQSPRASSNPTFGNAARRGVLPRERARWTRRRRRRRGGTRACEHSASRVASRVSLPPRGSSVCSRQNAARFYSQKASKKRSLSHARTNSPRGRVKPAIKNS